MAAPALVAFRSLLAFRSVLLRLPPSASLLVTLSLELPLPLGVLPLPSCEDPPGSGISTDGVTHVSNEPLR